MLCTARTRYKLMNKPSSPSTVPGPEIPLFALCVVAAFAVYAATLLGLEWVQGQDGVRPYFSDIQGPTFLFAINTTLSSGLQGVASVFFFVAFQASRMRQAGTPYLRMAVVQGLFYAWTAADDRFLLHERLPDALEAAYWLVLGGAYVLFIVLHRACLRDRRPAMVLLVLGGALFGAMLVADLLVPLQAPLRLSVEDLFKAAASLALAGFAWNYLKAELRLLRSS